MPLQTSCHLGRANKKQQGCLNMTNSGHCRRFTQEGVGCRRCDGCKQLYCIETAEQENCYAYHVLQQRCRPVYAPPAATTPVVMLNSPPQVNTAASLPIANQRLAQSPHMHLDGRVPDSQHQSSSKGRSKRQRSPSNSQAPNSAEPRFAIGAGCHNSSVAHLLGNQGQGHAVPEAVEPAMESFVTSQQPAVGQPADAYRLHGRYLAYPRSTEPQPYAGNSDNTKRLSTNHAASFPSAQAFGTQLPSVLLPSSVAVPTASVTDTATVTVYVPVKIPVHPLHAISHFASSQNYLGVTSLPVPVAAQVVSRNESTSPVPASLLCTSGMSQGCAAPVRQLYIIPPAQGPLPVTASAVNTQDVTLPVHNQAPAALPSGAQPHLHTSKNPTAGAASVVCASPVGMVRNTNSHDTSAKRIHSTSAIVQTPPLPLSPALV